MEELPGIATLPDELLLLIFKLLPVEDILCCEEVSQQWSILARDPSIWRDIKIIYNPQYQNKYIANLRLLETHSDVIQCVYMCKMICYKDIQHILSACKNLTSFALYDSEFMDFSDVSLTWLWPQIKKLELINVYPSSLLQFDKLNALSCLKLNQKDILDLRSLIYCANLKCLHLYGGKSIDDEGLGLLSEYLNLSELVIFRCNRLTDKGLLLLTSLKNLRVLDISHNEQFTEKALESFLRSPNIKQVRRLKLTNIDNVTPEMLVLISDQYTSLEYLSMRKCRRLDSALMTSWGLYKKHIENLRKKIKFFQGFQNFR